MSTPDDLSDLSDLSDSVTSCTCSGNIFRSSPDILTISEAATLLRLSDADMQKLLDSSSIKCLKIFENTLIPKKLLINFLENSCQLNYTQGTSLGSGANTVPEPMYLDNHIAKSNSMPFPEGASEMASKSKINQPVVINGEKRWITANSMQEFTDKVAKLLSVPQNTGKHLFSTYAWNWYNTYSRPSVETATAITYKRQLTLHILPAFDGLNVEDISVDHVQHLFNGMTGAKATKDKVKIVLNQIFEAAIDDKLMLRNPLKSKRLKITGTASKTTTPYSVEEMRFIVQHIGSVQSPMDRTYLALQALHPMRLEEVLGLRPCDIDLDNMEIHISRAVTHPSRNQPEVKETKTESSSRTIGLSALALPFLDIHTSRNFLFGGNAPLSYTQVRRMCNRIKNDIGFDGNITPIRFRTTVLTDLYDQTKDIKLTQNAAGHTTSAMTLKYYVKGRESHSEAAAAVDRAYSA